jgi:hypothetical protein
MNRSSYDLPELSRFLPGINEQAGVDEGGALRE